MKRSIKRLGSISAALALLFAAEAQAGPRIEFGDDGGYLQIDLKGQFYLENTDYGAGADVQGSRNDLHFMRNRFSLTGMIDDTWGYKFQTCGNTGTSKNPVLYSLSSQDTDWNDRDVRIIDAYVIGNFDPSVKIKVGLTKIPLTRANLDDCFAPLSQDRSMFVYSAYGTSPAKFSRDLGGVAYGRFFNDRVTYFAGLFQGREGSSAVQIPVGTLAGQTATSSNAPKSNFEYVGRLTYDFLDSEGGSGYQGTYFGDKKIFNIGLGVAYQADVAYRTASNAITYSDGTTTAGAGKVPVRVVSKPDTSQGSVDYKAFAADVMFEYPVENVGVFTTTAQYLKVDFDDAYKTNTASGDRLAVIAGMNGQKEGYYVKGAYILPLTVGKEGKIQPYALYEDWDFAHLLGVDNQNIKQYGGGINYYILGDQRVRLTGEFLRTDFDKATTLPVAGTAGYANAYTFDTYRMMLQLVF